MRGTPQRAFIGATQAGRETHNNAEWGRLEWGNERSGKGSCEAARRPEGWAEGIEGGTERKT